MHISGEYGLDHEPRNKPLSRDKYFSQRILNENPMYAENHDYVFMAQQAKERHSIESQINMAMSHGTIETNESGQVVVPSDDAFNIFQKVPGTPAYWKLFRNELYAKMEALGPFHVFFTMSCGEARWAYVLLEVLKVKKNRSLKAIYLDCYVNLKKNKLKKKSNNEIIESDSETDEFFDEDDSQSNEPEKELSSIDKKFPERQNVSWDGETSTVLIYDKNLTNSDLEQDNERVQHTKWKRCREDTLKKFISDQIERIKELEENLEQCVEELLEHSKDVIEDVIKHAIKTQKLKQEITKIENELNELTPDEIIGFDLTEEEDQSDLITYIIQFEDESKELKDSDIRYIITKLKKSERNKIMSLDDYLNRYLKQNSMNKTDFLKDNFILITRIFDKRVNDFMQSVMKAQGMEDFAYRVEFQLRGLPHVHGVGWLKAFLIKNCVDKSGSFIIVEDKKKHSIEKDNKDKENEECKKNTENNSVKNDEKKENEEDRNNKDKKDIENNNSDNNEEINQDVITLINNWTSCSTSTGDEKLDKIVKAVQVHKHTKKSCLKHGHGCRFNFPRPPSNKTIISRPIEELYPEMSDEDRQKKIETAKTDLKIVKQALEELEDECFDYDDDLEKFLNEKCCEIPIDRYNDALKISVSGGYTVILERKVSERNVNNYHPIFLKEWNANTDIQICLDSFAVVSYITDYLTKCDKGLTALLSNALREKRDADKFDLLNHLKRTYFLHKQTCVCEAAYRLIPGLDLKGSTVKCLFLASGFDRKMYYHQIPDENDDSFDEIDHMMNLMAEMESRQSSNISSEPQSKADSNKTSKAKNKADSNKTSTKFKKIKTMGENKYIMPESKHEKYKMRPDDNNCKISHGVFTDMCFAQFCLLYEYDNQTNHNIFWHSLDVNNIGIHDCKDSYEDITDIFKPKSSKSKNKKVTTDDNQDNNIENDDTNDDDSDYEDLQSGEDTDANNESDMNIVDSQKWKNGCWRKGDKKKKKKKDNINLPVSCEIGYTKKNYDLIKQHKILLEKKIYYEKEKTNLEKEQKQSDNGNDDIEIQEKIIQFNDKKRDIEKKLKDIENLLDSDIDCHSFLKYNVDGERRYLPQWIRLNNDRTMKLRTKPYVLRMYSYPKDILQKKYSELLLFTAWKKEEDFRLVDEDKLTDDNVVNSNKKTDGKKVSEKKRLFSTDDPNFESKIHLLSNKKMEEWQKNRTKILPYSKKIDDIRTLMESEDFQKSTNLYDSINPQGEQENAENAADMDISDNDDDDDDIPEENQVKHPRKNKTKQKKKTSLIPEKIIYKKIPQPEKEDELFQSVRNLTFEQRIIFDKFIHYAQSIKCARHGGDIVPEPPKIIAHGKYFY